MIEKESIVAAYGVFRWTNANGNFENVGFIPSPTSTSNQIGACIHRFCREVAQPNPWISNDFYQYCVNFIDLNFQPLTPDELASYEEWEKHVPYNQKRKEALREYRNLQTLPPDVYDSKSFGKWEQYATWKHMRAINSPSDISKSILGPLIYSSDKKTFKTRYFVKGSDPRTWPARLRRLFGNLPVVETDFSSFESHHQGIFSCVILYWLDRMTRHVRTEVQWQLINQLVMGHNRTIFKNITCTIAQRLMSGVMFTSSANGVLNLMIMSYLASQAQAPNLSPAARAQWSTANFLGLFEGDDGIGLDYGISRQQIINLGVDLSFDRHENFAHANFCGITCPVYDGSIITDPIAAIRKFFVIPPKYMRSRDKCVASLMRAKALSYLTLYRDCPIVGPLAHRVCTLTRSYDARPYLAETKHYLVSVDETDGVSPPNIAMSTRQLMWDKFHISPSRQLEIEQAIAEQGPWFRIDLTDLLPPEVINFAVSHLTEDGEHPGLARYDPPAVVAANIAAPPGPLHPRNNTPFLVAPGT